MGQIARASYLSAPSRSSSSPWLCWFAAHAGWPRRPTSHVSPEVRWSVVDRGSRRDRFSHVMWSKEIESGRRRRTRGQRARQELLERHGDSNASIGVPLVSLPAVCAVVHKSNHTSHQWCKCNATNPAGTCYTVCVCLYIYIYIYIWACGRKFSNQIIGREFSDLSNLNFLCVTTFETSICYFSHLTNVRNKI